MFKYYYDKLWLQMVKVTYSFDSLSLVFVYFFLPENEGERVLVQFLRFLRAYWNFIGYYLFICN
jgi:hypothetical protein